MRSNKGGCCGHPAKCAFTTHSGRCMAREQYEQQVDPDRMVVADDPVAAKTKQRKLARIARKQRQKELSRGRGVGREISL